MNHKIRKILFGVIQNNLTFLHPFKQWKSISIALCLSYSFLFIACSDANRVYEEYKEIPKHEWSYEQALPFEVEINDTTQRYHIGINLRHTNNYSYSNLWVLLKTIYPSGKEVEHKVDLPLANKAGKWYGHGSGDIISAEMFIQQYVKLPEIGTYQFELTQNMRMNPLPNIMDIGIRIEKAEED